MNVQRQRILDAAQEKREREQIERSALGALGLSGRIDELPADFRKLVVILHDLMQERKGLDARVMQINLENLHERVMALEQEDA